jgi:hypothetical protein
MRKAILIAAVVALAFAPVAFAQSSESYYGGSFTRMSFIKGDVFIQHGQDAGFEQGELNLVVLEGDKLGTKDGRLEVQLGRRNYLRLGDYTQVDIVTLPRQDGGRTKIHLLAGRAFVRVGSMGGEKNFEIHTPDASFYVLESGLYSVEVRENRETEFAVFSGSAEAAGEEGSVVVNARQQITAANGRLVSSPEALIARRDDFGDWNASRDAIYAKKVDRTYLPADYSDYETELADNGRWVNEAEYGNVWVPNVSTSDWRPYYNGRWAWYPIIGWTWVSYDSWGWCTSHYGRWGWGNSYGWYWIPERNWGWGPAWVNWYWGSDYIGWCPRSYYGYAGVLMNNRFYGRYSDRYYPNNSLAMTVVHRDQLQNRRLSGAALDRNGMNRLGNISLRNAQPDRRPMLNANGDMAAKARQALSRDGLRSVGQSFSTGRRLSSDALRSSSRSAAGSASASPARRAGEGASAGSGPARSIRSSAGDANSRSLSRSDGTGTGQAERRAVERGTYLPRAEGGSSSPQIRSFPSKQGNANSSSGSAPGRIVSSPSRAGSGASPRTGDSGSAVSSRSRETVNRDAVRAFPSRKTGGENGSPSSSVSPSRSINSPARVTESPSRRTGTPARRIDTPSRSSGSTVRSYGSSPSGSAAPSRSLNAPSRSSSSPSRSYSAPSRSSSAPSRSYSAPSRSSGSSAPSFSAPSRSSNSPSRSFGSSSGSSAPSRSVSTPSRSSSGSGPSRSSGSSSSSSGGRVRK